MKTRLLLIFLLLASLSSSSLLTQTTAIDIVSQSIDKDNGDILGGAITNAESLGLDLFRDDAATPRNSALQGEAFDNGEENPYSTNQPHIRLTTKKTRGKWQFTLGIAKADKATAWVDLNGNGVYDKGEEEIKTYRLWKPNINAQTITIYGKFNWISCSLNELTELDVSQNNFITYLACDGNQLSQLNLSSNSAIDKLYCNGNQLQNLDLSALPLLKELYCFDNPALQALDLTKQTKLEELYTNRCALTELKLSSHPSLTQLKADENRLVSIDLSQVRALHKLWLNNNQLTQMDLSGFRELEEVQLQSNKISAITLPNPSVLSILACGDNPLKSLDLSSQQSITLLDCSEAELSQLDLSSCPALKVIYCYSNKLVQQSLDKLLKQLPSRTADDNAFCIVVDTTDPDEQNEASSSRVSEAESKGWRVYDFRGGENEGCNPYQGTQAIGHLALDTPRIQVQGRQLEILGDYTEGTVLRANGEVISTKFPVLLPAGEYVVSLTYQGGRVSQKVFIE
jgi:hypothetical protein